MNDLESKPLFLNSVPAVKSFLKKNPHVVYNDAYDRQIKELFFIDNHEYIGQEKIKVYKTSEFIKYKNKKKDEFVHIYYSWNNIILKCVKEVDYFKLKTNRNHDLITEEEQKKLRDYKVAVFGMSVGSNIAFVLTQAGISKDIIIADFDELDTTNLNRIWAGVHQVGLNKCVIAARRIYEDNPFAKVVSLETGITLKLLEKLLVNKKIDCIVEEIDNMGLKIEIRKLAMKYKIPAIMITDNGDWGVLHVERYDLGYKKIFERDLDYWDKRLSSYSGSKDFADIVINQIVGGLDKVDPRMLRSAQKVMNKELVSWPQLGSAALLGGVAVTVAVKDIVRQDNVRKFTKKHLFPLSEK